MENVIAGLLGDFGVWGSTIILSVLSAHLYIRAKSKTIENSSEMKTDQNDAVLKMLASFQTELNIVRSSLDETRKEAHQREIAYQKEIFELKKTISKMKLSLQYLNRLLVEKQKQIDLLEKTKT